MHRSPISTFEDLIAAEMARFPPSRVLLMGMRWPAMPRPPRLEVLSIEEALVDDPSGGPRVELAVLLVPDHGLDPAQCLRHELVCLLASLRDVRAARVLLAMPLAGTAPARDAQCVQLRALGFCALGTAQHHGCTLLAHRFDLADYKPTPQWLNPDNWAHPQLWNRHRW